MQPAYRACAEERFRLLPKRPRRAAGERCRIGINEHIWNGRIGQSVLRQIHPDESDWAIRPAGWVKSSLQPATYVTAGCVVVKARHAPVF